MTDDDERGGGGGTGSRDGLGDEGIAEVELARAAERRQTRFYRALAARAMDAGDHAAEERLNELHADEQHHLARLTARLLELGHVPAELEEPAGIGDPPWPSWEAPARIGEEAEVRRYEDLLESGVLDGVTREIVVEILVSERHHARVLGGKWVSAAPGGKAE